VAGLFSDLHLVSENSRSIQPSENNDNICSYSTLISSHSQAALVIEDGCRLGRVFILLDRSAADCIIRFLLQPATPVDVCVGDGGRGSVRISTAPCRW
jgi:hypothetical protein